MIKSLFIRKRNNRFCVICEYRDEVTRKKHQKQLGAFEKKKDANVLLTQEKLKLDQGMFIRPNLEINLANYLVEWNDSRKGRLAITTYNYYSSMIRQRYGPKSFLGKFNLKELTPTILDKFYIQLRNEGLSENTIAKHHKMLSKAFDDAKKKQLIYKNICEYIEKPRTSKSDISKFLTLEQSQLLLHEVTNTIYELPVNLALGLGLRAGEVFGLTWDNIDFENNTIHIIQTIAKNKETNELFFKEPKTATSKRVLFMPSLIKELLKKQKIKKKENEYNLVFINRLGRPYDPSDFSKNFRKFLQKNNLEIIRFHDLRHTNASLHLLAGTDLKVTSKNLGHSNIGITADLYTHVLEELDKTAATNIDNILYKNQ